MGLFEEFQVINYWNDIIIQNKVARILMSGSWLVYIGIKVKTTVCYKENTNLRC